MKAKIISHAYKVEAWYGRWVIVEPHYEEELQFAVSTAVDSMDKISTMREGLFRKRPLIGAKVAILDLSTGGFIKEWEQIIFGTWVEKTNAH